MQHQALPAVFLILLPPGFAALRCLIGFETGRPTRARMQLPARVLEARPERT